MKKIILVLIVLSFPFYKIIPQETNARTITAIEITGLRRTKPHIAEYPLEKFLGMDIANLEQLEVEAAVIGTGVLDFVSMEFIEDNGGLILHITVHEKWAIIPFPYFAADSSGINLGLFLMDSNAFGIRDTAILGGMYMTGGWLATAMYMHTPGQRGLLGWNASLAYSSVTNEDQDREEARQRLYGVNRFGASFGIYKSIVNNLSGSMGVSYSNISINNNSTNHNAPEQGAQIIGLSPGLSIRYNNWDGFFMSQTGMSLQYTYNLALLGTSFHHAQLRATYEQSIIPGFRVLLRSSLSWKSTDNPLFEDGPERAQVGILPNRFSALQYAGFSAGLEKSLFRIRWGTLSASASWQAVFSEGPIGGTQFDHGPSGGLRFYLSRLAMPAIGAGIAYNMNTGIFQFALNMGTEF